jgi:hypothetical protein
LTNHGSIPRQTKAQRGVTINLWLSERQEKGIGPQREKDKETINLKKTSGI